MSKTELVTIDVIGSFTRKPKSLQDLFHECSSQYTVDKHGPTWNGPRHCIADTGKSALKK